MAELAEARAWLQGRWSPVLMVVASPEADEVCRGSTGLAVVELLRPFGLLPQLNGTVGGGHGVLRGD